MLLIKAIKYCELFNEIINFPLKTAEFIENRQVNLYLRSY